MAAAIYCNYGRSPTYPAFLTSCCCNLRFLYAVCAGDYDGIHHGQDNDGQRVCCLYEEAAFTGADHHSYVRDIPIFPTVVEEYNAIGDAMKMRGIRFGGGKASAMLEYRLVPVIMCSVKIGEELNAAALTRGLGGPVKRTNICEIGFHVQDVFFLLLCVVAFAIPIVTMITGR